MCDILFFLDTSAGWINISTNSEAVEQNLFDYFEPRFEMGQGHVDQAVIHISLLLDPGLNLGEQLDGAEKDVRLLGGYDRKGEFLVMGKKRVQGKKREFFIRADAPDVKVTVEGKRILVVGTDPNRIARESRRFVRDHLIAKLWAKQGRPCIHASATAFQGRGVMVMGSAGSGKTSTVLHLMARQDHDLVSGERVFLSLKEEEIIVHGSLEPLHLDLRSLQLYEDLRDVPLFSFCAPTVKSPGEGLVERAVLVRAFGCEYVPACPLSLVLLPRVDNLRGSLKVEKVSWDVAGSLLMDESNVFSLHDPYRPNWIGVFHSPRRKVAEQVQRIVDRLNRSNIPCLSILGAFEEYIRFLGRTSLEEMLNWN
jgi:hypothetical protein